jgi:AcrR family transcriptional regulator
MPPKFKTDAERQLARHHILDAARELFVSKGVEAVTMREIAKKIDYSPTTIYLYFKDKDALILDLCNTDFQTLAKELNAILTIQAPVERMLALGRAYSTFALHYPNHYQMMFMTKHLNVNIDAEGQADASLDAYHLLNHVVGEVFSAGYFIHSLKDAELIAQTLWAAIHGVCSLEITMGEDKNIAWRNVEARINLMLNTLMRGMLREAV